MQESGTDSEQKMNSMELSVSPSNSRKTRKPYTITKARENWTDEEHAKFLEALKLYDRDWKKIEKFIGTKNVIQIRSHAQKYFLKVQKNNTGERIPPPRPKRKSTQPYPQKQKQDTVSIPWVTTPENMAVNPYLSNPAAFSHWMASNGLLPGVISPNFNPSHAVESQRQQQEQLQQAQHYLQQAMTAAQQNLRGVQQDPQQGPNFAKIYSFLGSLFDPSATNHAETLNEMSPIDRETVQLLMHNLALNLANQQFREQHAYLLDQYRSVIGKTQTELSGQQVSSTSSDSVKENEGHTTNANPLMDNVTMNPFLNSFNNFTMPPSTVMVQHQPKQDDDATTKEETEVSQDLV